MLEGNSCMRWAVCYFKNIHKLDSSSNNISRNQYTYLKVDCVWKHLICQHQVVIGKLLNKISKMWSNLSPFSSFTLINRNMIQCILFCRLVVIYLFTLFCFVLLFFRVCFHFILFAVIRGIVSAFVYFLTTKYSYRTLL